MAPSDPEPAAVRRLLDGLPEWFGIDTAVDDYVEASRLLLTYAARDDSGAVRGVLLLERHFRDSAEIHLMAVERSWHRRGVGRALLATAESAALADGTSLLSAKTLGPSHPDAGYAGTRAFYSACGFLAVEELTDLWPGNPCLLMIKPLTLTGSLARRTV